MPGSFVNLFQTERRVHGKSRKQSKMEKYPTNICDTKYPQGVHTKEARALYSFTAAVVIDGTHMTEREHQP